MKYLHTKLITLSEGEAAKYYLEYCYQLFTAWSNCSHKVGFSKLGVCLKPGFWEKKLSDFENEAVRENSQFQLPTSSLHSSGSLLTRVTVNAVGNTGHRTHELKGLKSGHVKSNKKVLEVLTTCNNSACKRQIHKRPIYFLIRCMYQKIKLNCLICSLCNWQVLKQY